MSITHPILSRLSVIGLVVAVAGGAAAFGPGTARAGVVGYTMTCGDHWAGSTDVDRGETARGMANNSSCTSHFAWVNVHYSWGTSGKKRSVLEARPGVVVTVRHEFPGQTTKSWHSGCADGCHAEYSYA